MRSGGADESHPTITEFRRRRWRSGLPPQPRGCSVRRSPPHVGPIAMQMANRGAPCGSTPGSRRRELSPMCTAPVWEKYSPPLPEVRKGWIHFISGCNGLDLTIPRILTLRHGKTPSTKNTDMLFEHFNAHKQCGRIWKFQSSFAWWVEDESFFASLSCLLNVSNPITNDGEHQQKSILGVNRQFCLVVQV